MTQCKPIFQPFIWFTFDTFEFEFDTFEFEFDVFDFEFDDFPEGELSA